jgi:hypothetical protein
MTVVHRYAVLALVLTGCVVAASACEEKYADELSSLLVGLTG